MSYIYTLGPKNQNKRVVTIHETTEGFWGEKIPGNGMSVTVTSEKADEFISSYNSAVKKDKKNNFFKVLAGGAIVGGLGCFFAPKLAGDLSAKALKEARIFLGSVGALFGGLLGGCLHSTKSQDKVCEKFLNENE